MDHVLKLAVHLPASDLLDLELFLMDIRPGVKIDAFLTELVKRWLAIEKERHALRKHGQAVRGFQWKNVFLPEGTILRTSYGNVIEFAKVVGHRIISDDKVLATPSVFANQHAKGRNAWRFIWLRFPGDDYWIRAANCRRRSDAVLQKQAMRTMA